MKKYTIDGKVCKSESTTCTEVSRALNLTRRWNGSLDALNDILYGGFGTPDEGFELVWTDAAVSRKHLGRWFDRLLDVIASHEEIKLTLR